MESDLINSTENLKHAWLPNTIRIKEHVICKKRYPFVILSDQFTLKVSTTAYGEKFNSKKILPNVEKNTRDGFNSSNS